MKINLLYSLKNQTQNFLFCSAAHLEYDLSLVMTEPDPETEKIQLFKPRQGGKQQSVILEHRLTL